MRFSSLFTWFSRVSSVVGALVLLLAASVGVAYATAGESSPFQNLSVFGEALSIIERAYVDPVDQDGLIHGALRGLLESLDPHNGGTDPNRNRNYRCPNRTEQADRTEPNRSGQADRTEPNRLAHRMESLPCRTEPRTTKSSQNPTRIELTWPRAWVF